MHIETATGEISDITTRRARALLKQGEYEAARNLLERSALTSVSITGGFALTYAATLQATSDYDAAVNMLQLAKGDPARITLALSTEAEIAWIRRDYRNAHALAIECLRHNLFDTKAQRIRDRAKLALEAEEARSEAIGLTLSHAAFYVTELGNFGDVALPPTVRGAYQHCFPVESWLPFHIHQEFDEECLRRVNESSGLVIGGGGLFLPDTAPNGNSGWQWNVPLEHLRRIDVPIAVTAVGYNLFRGQSMTSRVFRDSLELLVDKCAVFGLRNRGSMERVASHLPASLRDKVEFMPCPTTILSKLEPNLERREGVEDVLLNIAYDRFAMRYGKKYGLFLRQLEEYVLALNKAGFSVGYAAHLQRDERFVDDLARQRAGLQLRVHPLYNMPLRDAYAILRGAGLVVGMRGHATMIPFGLGTPVMSIISHPKLRYFLEDIDHLEWGVDFSEPDLGMQLFERSQQILLNRQSTADALSRAQDKLYGHIVDGANKFRRCLSVDTGS